MLADLVGAEEEGLLSRLQAEGSVNSQVQVTGTVARPQLQGMLSLADGRLTAPGWKQAVEDVGVEARFSRLGGETLFELAELHARADATTLEAAGRAQLGTFDPARLHQNEYDFSARIAAEEQTFGGDVKMADVGGEIQLHTVDRGRQLLTVDDLGGEVGGGRVSLDGSVSLESFLPSRIAENQFNLALRVDQARPRYSHLFSGNVDGEITVTTPAPDQPARVAGALEVSKATVGIPAAPGEATGEMKGMPEDFPSPSFDVAVLIGPKVQVEGGGMVAPLQPTDRALRLSGTPQEPLLRGRVDVQEGEASVPGGVLQIESGGVEYMLRKALGSRRPPVTLELHGRVWASAHRTIPAAVVNGREVGPVRINLEVGGTLPANIFIQATSDPPMAEEEIYALLGTQPLLLAGLGAEESLTDVMSKQFLSALGTAFRHYVFQPFEEELREMLGLSMLEVSFAFDQPLEVKVGRYLLKDLLVTYQRSLSGDQEGFDLAISYEVRDQVEVSYRTDESDEDRLLVEYVRSF
jgi:autotransporter translocation and assembly factor TamB